MTQEFIVHLKFDDLAKLQKLAKRSRVAPAAIAAIFIGVLAEYALICEQKKQIEYLYRKVKESEKEN